MAVTQGLVLLALFAISAAQVAPGIGQAAGKVRMCVFSLEAMDRQGGGRFTPANINASLCTHILVTYADVSASGSQLVPASAGDPDLYREIVALKKQTPGLKVLLSVGGAGVMRTKRFEDMTASSQTRVAFISSAVSFLQQYGFDGLDLSWLFPVSATRQQLTLLVAELWLAFSLAAKEARQPKALLTVTVWGRQNDIIQFSYEPVKMEPFVDYFLLMTYNLWGQPSPVLGHHTALRVRPQDTQNPLLNFSVDQMVSQWEALLKGKDKLVMGLAAFGVTTRLNDPQHHDLGDGHTQSPASPGPYTKSSTFLAYYEICQNLAGGWKSADVPVTEGAIAYSAQTPYDWVCYDNTKSMATKAEYALQKDVAGVFLWTLDYDDFTGSFCGQGPYPLLSAVKDVFERGVTTASPSTTPTSPTTTPTPTTPTPTTPTPTTPTPTTPTPTTPTPTSPTPTTPTATTPTPTTPTPTTPTPTSPTPTTPTSPTTTPSSPTTSPTTSPTPTPPPSTSSGPGVRTTQGSTSSGSTQPDCKPFQCPSTVSPSNPHFLYPNPFDCSTYYQCVDPRVTSVKYLMSCPASLYFNPATRQCDYPRNVACVPCPTPTPAP